MKWFRREWAASILWGLVLGFTLCASSVHAQTAVTEPPAEVNGEAITAKDLERALGARLSQLQEQLYNLKRGELDALIAQRLLAQEAAKRSVSVAALLDAEVTSKVGLVTEKEIENFYQPKSGRCFWSLAATYWIPTNFNCSAVNQIGGNDLHYK